MTIKTALVIAAMALAMPAWAQSFPDPHDTTALYAKAKQEGKLVWYSSAPAEASAALAAAFTQAYPGVSVEVLRMLGPAQYERFVRETEAKQYIADVVGNTDEPSMADLVRRHDIAEWKIPTHDRFTPDFRIGSSVYAPFVVDNTLVYNVNKVTPEELKLLADWQGLLDPRFKGRFAVTNQKCGACYSPIHLFMDPKFKDRYGPDFVRKLAAQQPAVYSDIVTLVDRVAAGEQDFAIPPGSAITFLKFQAGAPIRWIYPRPAPLLGGGWQGVSAFAPHPYAARLFQDWSLSEEGAHVIETKYGAVPGLSGIPDERVIRKQPCIRSPEADKYAVDWDRWTRNYDADMGLWTSALKAAR